MPQKGVNSNIRNEYLHQYLARSMPKVPLTPRVENDELFARGWMAGNVAGSKARTTERSEIGQLREEIAALRYEVEALKNQLTVCTDKIRGLCDDVDSRPIVKEAEIIDIGNGFKTLRPIHVVIEEAEEQATVSLPEIELSATGETESDAILNFKKELASLYRDLFETPTDKLGKLPASWLRILQKVMKPVGQSNPV